MASLDEKAPPLSSTHEEDSSPSLVQAQPPTSAKTSTPPLSPSSSSSNPSTLATLDRTLTHLQRALSTPSGTDTLLLTLGYTTLLTATLLKKLSVQTSKAQLLQLLRTLRALPPNTTLLVKGSTTLPQPAALPLATSLAALSSTISDFRIFARLWGLVGLYAWAKSVALSPPKDALERAVVRAQVGVNVAFQVLENAAYLASKGVLRLSERAQARAWVWSSRFWAAHVGLEFLRLGVVGWERGGGSRAERLERWEGWCKQMVVNCAWAPLTLHWSVEKGLIGDAWVGFFGSVAGIVGFRELWKKTT